MMATLSHSFSTTSSTWLEKNTADPPSASSRSISFTWKDASGSRPTKGSSSTSSVGSCTSAPMSTSFCRMPCEYEDTRSPSAEVSPRRSANWRMRASRTSAGTSKMSER